MPVQRILSSVPQRLPPRARSCNDGQQWRWDGVDFRILHPPPAMGLHGNNASCVLRVSNGRYSVLLPGDIEEPAEQQLLARHGQDLAATVVVAPHHGSNTSSGPDFVRAAAPAYVLFSSGYLNRYGFPRAPVLRRYHAAGAVLLTTAESGAISFSAGPRGLHYSRWRLQARRFWQSPP